MRRLFCVVLMVASHASRCRRCRRLSSHPSTRLQSNGTGRRTNVPGSTRRRDGSTQSTCRCGFSSGSRTVCPSPGLLADRHGLTAIVSTSWRRCRRHYRHDSRHAPRAPPDALRPGHAHGIARDAGVRIAARAQRRQPGTWPAATLVDRLHRATGSNGRHHGAVRHSRQPGAGQRQPAWRFSDDRKFRALAERLPRAAAE